MSCYYCMLNLKSHNIMDVVLSVKKTQLEVMQDKWSKHGQNSISR